MNIQVIIQKIDEFLQKTGKSSTNPVEANEMLERTGLLRDSDLRPGLPLRNLLRAGLLPHAYQTGGKGSTWVIPHSGTSKKTPLKQKVKEEPKLIINPKASIRRDQKPSFIDMDFNSIESLKKHGFSGFQSIGRC